ncbi:AAA family ATPase [Motiliproteus sediminis]|uniref:bifunctional aminoglycoside phosphotransferase/ATP-binding protein n=1 Tax=Motiliproteus sediminis TaxID=1468178 RepID=UPI001AEF54C9
MNDTLIGQLQQQAPFDHPVEGLGVIETHISWVLLTGPYAYKFRKPVNFGFLDFTTLARRREDCVNELRLNQRLAAPLYVDLVRVERAADGALSLTSEPADMADADIDNGRVEFAVRMRQFPQSQLLSALDADHQLSEAIIDRLAERLAAFHQSLSPAPTESDWGSVETVTQVVEQNFAQIRASCGDRPPLPELTAIEQWSRRQLQQHEPLLRQRRREGRVREGHGDLHLGNIVLWQKEPLPFDAIEFNPRYRWVDTLNDLAFLLMDLERRQRRALAWRLLNRYLEITGDYSGVTLLPLFKSYRAMVRAKVALLGDPVAGVTEAQGYIELAARYQRPTPPQLMLMHGVSGSGKSWHSARMAQQSGLIRLRSDCERKRLFPALAQRYTGAANERTYGYLLEQTLQLLNHGIGVIVDAAFLYQAQRQPFIEAAISRNIPVSIITCAGEVEQLRQRINQRQQQAQDPSEASIQVLEQQLRQLEPLTVAESRWAISPG